MTIRNIIEINEELCDGCGQCILDCAEHALMIIDGKAKVISDHLCDGLGACLTACPQGALKIIQREAAPFDEAAVAAAHARAEAQHQATQQALIAPYGDTCIAPACPSLSMPHKKNTLPWPLKLRIMPEDSPFLRHADIVLVADCAPAIYKNFHAEFGHKVKIACCPKFEDHEMLAEKLSLIMEKAQPNSLEVLRMEVPCCSALVTISTQALQKSPQTPLRHHVCARGGSLLP